MQGQRQGHGQGYSCRLRTEMSQPVTNDLPLWVLLGLLSTLVVAAKWVYLLGSTSAPFPTSGPSPTEAATPQVRIPAGGLLCGRAGCRLFLPLPFTPPFHPVPCW